MTRALPRIPISTDLPCSDSISKRNVGSHQCWACNDFLGNERAVRLSVDGTDGVVHLGCFRCKVCDCSLEHLQFYCSSDGLYCHVDWHDRYSPICHYCKTSIEDDGVIVGQRHYHYLHHFCAGCSEPFLREDDREWLEMQYFMLEGLAWCRDCYIKKMYPECTACEEPIEEDAVCSPWNEKFHIGCWKCAACDKALYQANSTGEMTSGYFIREGRKVICPECQAISVRWAMKRDINVE